MLDPGHLKIATWNVEKVAPGRSRRSQVVSTALQAVDADIVILTESHQDFAPSAGHTLAAASATAPDRVGGQRWVCIWIRRGWASTAIPLTGEPERSAAVRIVLPSGGALLVFGTVLPWRSDTRVPTFRGARAFVRSLGLQSDDLTRIRHSHPGDLLCFAGDWNQELAARPWVGSAEGQKALELFLVRHGLVALTAGGRDPLSVRGWRASIDHIAVSRSAADRATMPVIWPETFPLPKGWPDHHGVAVGLAAARPPANTGI
jgi:endonuclease/exonuclease/phosphatase family metal-dependent hydrolase